MIAGHTAHALVLADSPTNANFGHDPWWIILIKALAVFILLVVFTLFNIWYERRVVAKMQVRVGPNRNGPFGLLQSLADGVKLALKEDINPRGVDKIVFWAAPIVSTFAAVTAFAVIPFGPVVNMFGHRTPLQLADFPVAVLFILAMSSMGIYGIVLAGWSSASPYPLLGGLRSSAQMISYEVAMGLSFVSVFMVTGSLWTSDIVAAQAGRWNVVNVVVVPFLIYVVAMVGETNRAPFDLPEAEGELVGGFHTEYSSLKFALFFLAEYINMVTVSAVAVTLYLGGWRAPIELWDGANSGWWPLLWFVIKLLLCLFFFIWLRGTLPRLRYDQFMKLGWKLLIPLSLVWIVLLGIYRAPELSRAQRIVGVIVVIAIAAAGYFGWDVARAKRAEEEEQEDDEYADQIEEDPLSAGYPVPSLDQPHLRDVDQREVTPRA